MQSDGTRFPVAGRRVLAAFSALLLALALVVPLAPPAGALVEHEVAADRVAGPDRFATAAEVARTAFASSEAAIIASGEDFPDALVASYGPLGTDSPILLSHPRQVPAVTFDVLDELGVQTVYLMGGEAALHADIESQLRARGFNELFRVGGADRYDTAALTLDGPQQPEVGTLEGDRTALLASGEDFADALSAGPIAASASMPLLLTPSSAPHPQTDEALVEHDIERIVVIGGDAAVASAVVLHYQDEGYTVERWGGETRMATATTVADNAVERLGFTAEQVLLARGDDYPDALAAGVLGGTANAPLLLTEATDSLSEPTSSWLEAACPQVGSIRATGGAAAVTEDVLADAVAAAQACHDTPTAPTGIEVEDEQIIDEDGDTLLTIDDLPDQVQPTAETTFGGPTRFTNAVLSDDRTWIAIGSTGVAHGYGWLHDLDGQEHHFVAFQYGGSVDAHSWSPDDRFALFSFGSPADTEELKVVDRDALDRYPRETGFVVEVDEEAGLDPPYAYQFTEWRAPHTLCFEFEGTSYCVDAETAVPEPFE